MRALRWAGRIWTGVLLAVVLLVGLLLGLRLLLPLPFLSPRPELLETSPAAGTNGVAPRARTTLRFSVPMNRRSVEHALRITPDVHVALLWDDDQTTLTISPTVGLRPDSTYQVTLGAGALSRLFRAPERPLALSFHTAPAPAVVAVLPPQGAGEVPPDSPISIKFSRPIVPTTSLALPMALPQLRFEPPLEGSVTWIDQSTALFRPAAALQPATRYRATLAADLSDLGGGQLGSSFSWSFSTAAPKVLSVAPEDGARLVAPRAPLVLTLSQPLDVSSIQASLVITPASAGTLTTTILPDATQLITYTPSADWRPDTTYTVALLAGVAPAAGNLPLLAPVRWSFTTAPRPALTGRFPGEGQTLPLGQDIRLIFNTPVDEQALRQALRFTPPVDAIRVTARDVEARIGADMRASTTYTLTLPASLTDRNGVPLGQEYRVRFITAPANPALELADAAGHIVQVPPGPSASLAIRRTNVSALNLDLYGLDEATMVRMLAFREAEWSSFQPERYAQPLLRSWAIQLADPLNTPVEDRLALSDAQGQPLPPGAYYLRIRTPEGPLADLLVLLSRTRLTLQAGNGAALIWATDVVSDTALAGLPVALYQDGALIRSGTTDSSGLWRVDLAVGGPAQVYVALAGGDHPGVASSLWGGVDGGDAPDRYGVFLITDRAVYQPGARVELAGFVRRAASRAAAPPAADFKLDLTAHQAGSALAIYHEVVDVASTSVISAGFAVPPDAPEGEYLLEAALGNAVTSATFAVRAEVAPPLQVAVSAPAMSVAGDDVPVTVQAYTPEGLPVGGAMLSWTLNAERVEFPALDGYTFGDDERALAPVATRTGAGRTGADGRFGLVITGTADGDASLRYRLVTRATEPGGLSAEAEGSFLVAPARAYVGVRLPSRIFEAGQPGSIQVLAMTPDGRPLPRAAIDVEAYRRTSVQLDTTESGAGARPTVRPRDERVFTRRVVIGEDGAASVSLPLRAGGEYRVRASTTGADGQAMSSATSLWVAAPGFTGWREQPDGQALLIADRPIYQPGDTATLLPALPFAESTALVTLARDGGIEGQVRTIRAGEPLTITIKPEDAPAVRVAVLLPDRPGAPHPAGAAPFRLATATLPVLDPSGEISVTLTPDHAAYAPEGTATLTVTTTDGRGAGVPARVVLGVVGADDAPQRDLAEAFRTAMPLAAPGVPAPAASAPAPTGRAPEPAPVVYWNPGLLTRSDGVLTLTVRLPHEPADLRVLAWAAGDADQVGQARAALSVTRTLALRADAPLFFRAGDDVELAASIQNTSAISQEVRATLAAGGVEPLVGAPLTQRLMIGPGQITRVVWPAHVGPAPRARLSFSAQVTGAVPLTVQVERAILPPGAPEIAGSGALVAGRFSQSFTVPQDSSATWGYLDLDLAPSSLALAHDVARALADLPERSVLDEASLLLVTAPFSDTRQVARAALARLVAAQNDDGGWGWWPRAAGQPFVSAAVLEALAAAERAGVEVPSGVVEQAAASVAAALDDKSSSADLRAYALYALALHNRLDSAALRDLAANQQALGPEGLAYTILATPPATQGDRSLLSRLETLAQREGDLVHWPASDDALASSDTSATALAVLALERAQAGSELVPGARRWLAARRLAGGWPSGYESARALAALRASEPAATEAAGKYAVTLNGTTLLAGPVGAAITGTRQLSMTLDQLRAHNDLVVTSDGGPIFAGYRLVRASAQPPHADSIGLLREYLDPQTGRPVDPAQLRAGQLVRARLTVAVIATGHFVSIAEALPAGSALVEAGPGAGFEHVGRAPDQLTLSSATLAPGIYEYSYLLRATVPGRYSAPAPIARLPDGRVAGVGNTTTLTILAKR